MATRRTARSFVSAGTNLGSVVSDTASSVLCVPTKKCEREKRGVAGAESREETCGVGSNMRGDQDADAMYYRKIEQNG
jgi:hypothetical protein